MRRWSGTAGPFTSVMLIVIGLVGCGVLSAATDPEAPAIEKAALQGEVLTQRAADVPAGYLGGPLAPSIRKAMIEEARNQLSTVFAAHLVNALLDAAAGELDSAAAANPTNAGGPYPVVVQDGGARYVDAPTVAVNGKTAALRANVETWKTISQVRQGKAYPAHPRNVITLDETLVRQPDGHWLITERRWQFVPGHGP